MARPVPTGRRHPRRDRPAPTRTPSRPAFRTVCRMAHRSTRPYHSSSPSSVPPGPVATRFTQPVPMIGVVPDDRRCLVIGAGLLGLAAACAMSRRGWEVLVVEAAGAPGHEGSGSKGDARIFRLGYPDPLYVEMAVLALARWRELEATTGRRLLHVTGQVTLGDDATLESIARALEAAGAPVERVAASDAADRLPGIAATGTVLVEPDSGVLAADECLRALRETGRRRACAPASRSSRCATRRTPWWSSMGDGSELRADSAIVCAGPATLGLAGVAEAPAVAAPSLPQVAYFAARHGAGVTPPVFIEWGDDMVYGLPVPAERSARRDVQGGPAPAGADPHVLRPDRPRAVRRGRSRRSSPRCRTRSPACSPRSTRGPSPPSAASTTTPPTLTSCSTASAASLSGAAPADMPSNSARSWASSWPTWRRAHDLPST